jgi:diguanylate cyclase (GGDEF)-like protein/PAS domain S-box-containing protein
MASPIWTAANAPRENQDGAEIAAPTCETKSLNLPENSDSTQQQEVLDALPVLVFLERAGNVVFANSEARQALGIGEGDWVQRPVEDVLWGLFPGTAEPQTHLIGTRTGSPFHATLPARSGRLLPVEGTYSILNPELREAIIVAHPTALVRAPKSRLMEDVLASIPEAVVIVHGNHVLYTNPAFSLMFGYTAEEASGENLRELIVPETRLHEPAMLEKEVDQKGRVALETVRMNKDGELVDVALVAGPLKVGETSVGYVLSFRDIGDRKEAEAKVQHDALFDVPTGLANRALFLDRLTFALSRRSRRRDQNCGVILLDLDRFKEINDALGHAVGDGLLLAVAERLRASLRPEDSASRLGGDEFAVLVENLLDQADLETVASRILRLVGQPFEVFGSSMRVSASMGVAMAGPEHTQPELLIRDADFAMNRAKLDGGGCSEVFNRDLEMPFKKSLHDPERELRRVLEKRQYEVWYQPIYQLKSGNLEGFESLLRLRRPDGSVDTFRQLLGVAEDTGLSISLGRETMDAVCRQLRNWSDGVAQLELTLSLNLTDRQFYHPEMVAQLKKALAANAVDPSRLLFEVAESTLNQNQAAAAAILDRMAECKVRLAVDNFGARFAPLNHLARLPIDVVKISPKLTAAATSSGRQAAVLESLIHLGQTLGMQVIAQGIETPEQLEALCAMGCELGQGHLFSYAMEPARATILAGAGRWALAAGA